MENLVLVGMGGHGKSIIDSIERNGQYNIIGFTEVAERESYHGYCYLGTDENLETIYKQGVRYAFICIGYLGKNTIRDRLYKRLKSIGFQLPTIIDPSAVVSNECDIGEGTFVAKNVVINVGVSVGKMCIVNNSAVLGHEVTIGDFTHVAGGAVLCGQVQVEEHCLIGANSTVIQQIQIGAETIVGAGSVVLRDILAYETVYGTVK